MIFVIIGIALFFWSVHSNQFKDLDREAVNILIDEDIHPPSKKKKN